MMSGQSAMNTMTRQLAGQQPPKAEVGSAGVGSGFGEGAENLFNTAMFQDAAGVPNQSEGARPAHVNALDLRGQLGILGGTAHESLSELGINVRTPVSNHGESSLGKKSGTIFQGQDFRTNQQLSNLRNSDIFKQSPTRESALNPNRGDGRPASIADTQRSVAEQQFAQKQQAQILQLEREIALQGRRVKTPVSGRYGVTNKQTGQSRVEAGEAGLTLRQRVLQSIGFEIKRQDAARLFAQRQAQKAHVRKGPGSVLEGFGEKPRVDMMASMDKAQNEAGHEFGDVVGD